MKIVSVAGSFNNWQTNVDFMEKRENIFCLDLLLPKGKYEYKFFADNKYWLSKSMKSFADNYEMKNKELIVDDTFKNYSSKNYKIYIFGLNSQKFPSAEYISKDSIRFVFRSHKRNLEAVYIKINIKLYEMQNYFTDVYWDYYSVIVNNLNDIKEYEILMIKGSEEKYLKRIFKNKLTSKYKIRKRDNYLPKIQSSIIYQIFCDRFYNGDKSLNPQFKEWYYKVQENPLSLAVREKKYRYVKWDNIEILKDEKYKHYVFYGGDLKGVLNKLDYLIELGVTMLYFNPLVIGESNHKYDAFDYLTIDPHFGDNKLFKKLVDRCHKSGISVILDFAFNHTGIGFFAFRDCLKKGKMSQYYDWYDWYKFPLPQDISENFNAKEYYQCWWGHATLPDLNYDLKRFHPAENEINEISKAEVNNSLVQFLLQVAEFWLQEMNIDGFRLDVPNEVPFWFWQLFKEKVKNIKPQAYLVGEIWQNAEEWIPEYFDAVMNYTYFREPVLQFFAMRNIDTLRFVKTVLGGLHNYGFYNSSLMMNLLGSHDTYRFLEACNGDFRKIRLAILFQMCWIGIPHIYYGDEIGLQGGGDPDNRRPMNWNYYKNTESIELLEYVKRLAAIRKANPVLVTGDLKMIESGELLLFERRTDTRIILVIINNNLQKKQIDLKKNASYFDLVKNKMVKLSKFIIPALSGAILKKVE